MRRPLLLLSIALLLGLCSTFVRDRSPQERLDRAAAVLQARVDQAHAALRSDADEVLAQDTLDMGGTHASGEGGMRLYRHHRVTAWTDHAPIADAALDTVRGAHLDLADGTYLHAYAEGDGRSVHALARIWFQPPFENQYLRARFDPGFTLPEGIAASNAPGLGPVVRDGDGEVLLRLFWKDDIVLPGTGARMSLLLGLVALVLAVAALWKWAGSLRPWAGLLLFLVILWGLRLATLAHGSYEALASWPLFDPSLFASSFFMPSLGDLLINTAVLLLTALFFHVTVNRLKAPGRAVPVALASLALICAFADVIGTVMIALVHDSSVSLDLFRVQDFDGYSVAALLAIAGLLFAWCVLADALVRWVAPPMAGGRALALAAGACAALALVNHFSGQYDLVLSLWPLPVLALVHRLRKRSGTIPVLLLVAVLAVFTAHVLNRQSFKRIELEREALAENATTREDPVIELLFAEAKREMARDQPLLAWAGSGSPCTSSDLDRMVRQPFFTGYWDRYDLRLYLVSGRSFCSTSPDGAPSAQAIIDRYEQGVPTGEPTDLRITDRPGEDALYMGRVHLDSALLFLELRPRLVADGLGFPELLLAGPPPSSINPGRYAQARYERGLLTASSGPYIFPITWSRAAPGEGLRWVQDGYDLLAKGDPHGSLVVLGSRIPDPWDHVTTFSYLFLFYCLLVLVVGGCRLLVRSERGAVVGVGGKVRLGVAGFAVASLLLFSLGMRHTVDARQENRSTRIMGERTRGVLNELRQTLHGESALSPSMAPYLDHLLGNLSNVFFTDLTLYAPDGTLFATSREQVFNTGLLGRRMDPRAFRHLAMEGASSFFHGEHIGQARFTTAYMPFRNDQGKVLAYLALPYFARQTEVEQERAAAYVALVNLFTLLFLLSVVAAALITHWTTRPLELLRRGLERIGLGARNEPINYRGNDELGQLVRVYNRKVEELRESALKLARSERESAWREMAKQVAHEIKNPLTPMKLNIQQFRRTWDPAMPDARERLDRFSAGLVEQIDVLSRIAGEFSHFAQVPPAQPRPVDLAEVARTAVQLFADTPGHTVHLQGEGPLPVLADREHLLRVFNNLIKNALQAVPEERQGRVDVVLRRSGGEAVAEVRDNGTGIAPEDRDRIFQPSFTTKTSGMGLGLAMVKRMVEQAGGRVHFESTTEPGRSGSAFFVTLPLDHPPVHLPGTD